MRLIKNAGAERVIDELRRAISHGTSIDLATPAWSLFAFDELRDLLSAIKQVRLLLPSGNSAQLELAGSAEDRPHRNSLRLRASARACADWIEAKAAVRSVTGILPQSAIITAVNGKANKAITGTCSFTTQGLGLAPGSQLALIQSSENDLEIGPFAAWFSAIWDSLPGTQAAKGELLTRIRALEAHQTPSLIYFFILYHLFSGIDDELDEDRIVKSATGIRNTVVWKKLFKFQRDGVVGAIDKLNRYGGCIIADSVGLGKTFEALAVIKYHELRNDRVLVLCPKRLRDNWTLYRANDRRNFLAPDRFNFDVLNHTDLSREGGTSGDIDLANVNWGNYDLVVIDESHNFRNKATHRDRETRYDRLMRQIIKEGVKTRVLMLSATPVNNRLADLRNQIAFATEAQDDALAGHGIASIEATTRNAQTQFNKWLALEEADRTPARLMDMLGFDYFKLLDLLTIARSRKHIEKYYGTSETGKFPDRLPPINRKPDVDAAGAFQPIKTINNEIRRLTLAAYAPLRYVLLHKRDEYDAKYRMSVRGGIGYFSQVDREESLVHLLRVNMLKRMESSVVSFALTLQRQLEDVERLIKLIDDHEPSMEELSIEDVDIDDPTFETLLVGRKVKVLLHDVDLVRWRQDLSEDRNRVATLLSSAKEISPERDQKLAELMQVILNKVRHPFNGSNRKVLLFTAFADTAKYLYKQLAPWAHKELGLECALITGSDGIKTTIKGMRLEMATILAAFAPRAKERSVDLDAEGEIDLVVATDCISEGQNLQDCDCVINYDIHWNPVRIIQRFGRIDRIGSPNARVQLINFWPNMELEEYINLEQRVSGRMTLLDMSATGEDNVIQKDSGNQMNDLEYRRRQLEKLQDAVIDLEDLSSGVSITDLTLTDYRIELARFRKLNPGSLEALHFGAFAVTTAIELGDTSIRPGAIFCLKAVGEAALSSVEAGYPLAPHYVVHVGDDGAIVLPYTQAKAVLDALQKLCVGRDLPDEGACKRFDKATRKGEDMAHYCKLLSSAVNSILGKREERAVASLFTPGGTHGITGEFQGINEFEVIAYVVVLANGTGA
jgi:SNF2 family DNA or RNA helicase